MPKFVGARIPVEGEFGWIFRKEDRTLRKTRNSVTQKIAVKL